MSKPARSASPRRPGERLPSYCGLAAIKGTSSLKKPERRKLSVILGRALALAVGGKLYLFGKRNGDGDACFVLGGDQSSSSTEHTDPDPLPYRLAL